MTQKIIVVLILSLLLLSGCSGNVGLKGKVTFSDDGSPVPVGVVCLETDTYFSRGYLQPDGTFVVGTSKPEDGLPPGKYRVCIAGAEKSVGENRDGDEIYESLIDTKFVSGQTSGITIDVNAKTKYLEIVVDRYVPKKK